MRFYGEASTNWGQRLVVVAICIVAPLLWPGPARPVEVKDDHLVAYDVVDGAIPKSLTGHPGVAAAGAHVAVDRSLGNCMSCHAVGQPKEEFPGNVGPDLAGVGSRLKEGEIRLRIVDPKRLNEATSMPAFYKVDGLDRVAKAYAGKPILTAEQVEDLVAYLMTLKN
ncbi:MAG TPA: sulfur oxidation c-type cytochrome SoxX [Candidatus Cybelea sp.]|nr:sulfur oxidation c-type cytochrome SoxX [Candidatus Cybelea sp.]